MRAFLPIKPRQAQHREDRLLPLCSQKQGSPTPYSPSHCRLHIHTPPVSQCTNLGVVLDSEISIGPHVKRVSKSAFYHLRLISRIRRFLNLSAANTLVHAFVLSRIDYCNFMLAGLKVRKNPSRLSRESKTPPPASHYARADPQALAYSLRNSAGYLLSNG